LATDLAEPFADGPRQIFEFISYALEQQERIVFLLSRSHYEAIYTDWVLLFHYEGHYIISVIQSR
jgi:hypothetical protein